MTGFDTIVSLKFQKNQKGSKGGRTNVDIEALEGNSGLKITLNSIRVALCSYQVTQFLNNPLGIGILKIITNYIKKLSVTKFQAQTSF